MKFDVVVGNPPYQEESVGDNFSDGSIYHHFYELAEKISNKYCLISPARFLFKAGKTPEEWNNKMLNDKHLKVIHFEQISQKIFPTTEIKGGVAILYRDSNYEFGKIEIFVSSETLRSIIKKVRERIFETIDSIVTNRGQYRYSDLIYNQYPNEMERTSDRRIAPSAFDRFPEFFTINKPCNEIEYVQICGRISNERAYRWFRKDFLVAPQSFEKFKVVIPKASGSGKLGEVISNPFIGEPYIGFTETFISIGSFETEIEAINTLKYIKTKFARTMLGVLKITQNMSKETWSKVPLQDFTENSDIDWNQSIPEIDQQLYVKYGLSQDEIDFIETNVKQME